MLVFRLRHEFLEGFRLMVVILRLINWTDLHGGFYNLQGLQHYATQETTQSAINEAGDSVSLNWFSTLRRGSGY